MTALRSRLHGRPLTKDYTSRRQAAALRQRRDEMDWSIEDQIDDQDQGDPRA